jgi:hypothetical protein
VAVCAVPSKGAAPPQRPNWSQLDKSIHTAIGYAARTWGVSYSWLHSCAHSEGGHGRFIDTPGDGDGWFQFLPGTWTWMSNAAWKAGHKLGPHKTPPSRYRLVTSRLGQAWTAAWAFNAGYAYHWYGSGC